MLTRPIPRTGEALPVIGMGTYDTFDVADAARLGSLGDVTRAFLDAGGTLFDSSPMYGRAEAAVGQVLAALGRPRAFLATKVWTRGRADGIAQMERSEQLMGAGAARRSAHGEPPAPVIDLMQIHNLVDWRVHLATLREWKAAGRIRYLGVTHYQLSAFGDLEKIIRDEAIDFVQLPYSLAVRDAEARLLPAAEDSKTAVLVMRPFEKADMFARVRGKPLPDWAGEIGVTSWAQLFLEFILAHPAVTAPIPATANLAHLKANLAAGEDRRLGAEHRQRLVKLWDSL
jgi:aryl-alcohol dehydrogenase-like predicted oxidoreductase